jgi:hypothetical protein
MRLLVLILAAAIVVFMAAPAFSQTIYIWDKDHNKLFSDPEGGGQVDASYGIKKALDNNGYTYTFGTTLPTDLSPYDVIFVVMGTYC